MLKIPIFLLIVCFFTGCSSQEQIQNYTDSLKDAHELRELINSNQNDKLEKRLRNFSAWKYHLVKQIKCGKYKGMEVEKEGVRHRFEMGEGGVHEIWLIYSKKFEKPDIQFLGW